MRRNRDDGVAFQRGSVRYCRCSNGVYNELGPGFLEAVYQEALEIELRDRGIPFESQKDLPITYKGRPLKKPTPAICCAVERS